MCSTLSYTEVEGEVAQRVTPSASYRHSYPNQVRLIVTHSFRLLFGLDESRQRGQFVENDMSGIIHHYSDWIVYPKGDSVPLWAHKWPIMAVAISEDGRDLFTGSGDRTIIRWDLTQHTIVQQWTAHEDHIYSLAFHSGCLISGSGDRSIKVWGVYHPRHQSLMHTCLGHSEGVISVDFHKHGRLFVSSSYDSTLKLWSIQTGICLKSFTEHSDFVMRAVFVDDWIVSCSDDGCMKLWDSKGVSDQSMKTISDGKEGDSWDIAVNCDRTKLACLMKRKIWIYDWPSMDLIKCIEKRSQKCTFHPSDPNVLVFCQRGYVMWLDLMKPGSMEERIKGKYICSEQIRGLWFTSDGFRLVTVSDDKSVCVSDVSFLHSERKLKEKEINFWRQQCF